MKSSLSNPLFDIDSVHIDIHALKPIGNKKSVGSNGFAMHQIGRKFDGFTVIELPSPPDEQANCMWFNKIWCLNVLDDRYEQLYVRKEV